MTIVHIVDDDASVRTAISRLLQAAGYDVVVYESAEELLARLPEQSEPGCILLDVVMPGLSGPELQDYLRKLGSTLPIVFMTGSAEPTASQDPLIKPSRCTDCSTRLRMPSAVHAQRNEGSTTRTDSRLSSDVENRYDPSLTSSEFRLTGPAWSCAPS